MKEQSDSYNPQRTEDEILKLWEKTKAFHKRVKLNKGKKTFSFIDGPITANNPMGVHHAWGRTLKDVYQRMMGMRGYDQRYQNGFDCQGLWVEVGVEKNLGFDSKKDIKNYGIDKFSEACRQTVNKFSQIQTQQSIRLGQWMDWDNSYYTMSDTNIKYIWHFLKICNEKGWLYKGTRVLPWCPRCGTSSSKHEMSDDGYKELTHPGVFLKFKIKKRENEYLLAWTTTPWTLTSNMAAAINPNLDYAVVRQGQEVYYISQNRLGVLKEDHEVIDSVSGSELIGFEYESPYKHLPAQKGFTGHRVIPWKEVSDEEGTGIVHIAPGCGVEDNELGKKEGLMEVSPLDESGKFIDGFDSFTGKEVRTVNKEVIKDLEERGILYKVENYTHRYPICWRCKEELVFRMGSEWFIKADEIRPLMKREAEKVKWHPKRTGDLMQDWLTNMEDWNISRKRFWGLPLMFYECGCGNTEIIGSIKELKEKAVKPALVDKLPELHKPWIDEIKIKCLECGSEVSRISEVGDCWLDAGIVPYSTLKYFEDKKYWDKWFPADLIIEMRAQVRLWFYAMLFMSVTLTGRTPYNKVIGYEEVRDEKGETMHKSKGNAIWFDDAVEKMGADVMRWLYSVQNPAYFLKFGYGVAKETRQKINVLHNTANYVKTYCKANNYTPKKPVKLDVSSKYILSKLQTITEEVIKSADELKIYQSALMLEDFFLNDLSRWYIQTIRDKVKQDYKGSDKKAVLYTLYKVVLETLKLTAPFIPFITEKHYQDFFKKYEKAQSIHHLDYPKTNKKMQDKKLEKSMEAVKQIVESARNARQNANIKQKWPVKEIAVMIKKTAFGPELKELIRTMTNAMRLRIVKSKPEGNYVEAEFKNGKVFLNTDEDDELINIRVLKELVRNIQMQRKESKLMVGDYINLSLNAEPELLKFFKKSENELKVGTGARKLILGKTTGAKKEFEILGKKITVSFSKAGK